MNYNAKELGLMGFLAGRVVGHIGCVASGAYMGYYDMRFSDINPLAYSLPLALSVCTGIAGRVCFPSDRVGMYEPGLRGVIGAFESSFVSGIEFFVAYQVGQAAKKLF